MVTIRITVKGGKVIRLQKGVQDAHTLVDKVAAHGFLDPTSAAYYPPASLLGIAIEAAPCPLGGAFQR